MGTSSGLTRPPDAERFVLRQGTCRVSTAERTWARIRPILHRLGITRIAEVTDLEDFGIPTHTGLRPTGTTVSVSMGMAIDPVQSRVSAAMEAIETWHAENPVIEPAAHGSARSVGLSYDVRSLNLAVGSLLTEHTVLDWVAGTGLLTGDRMLVPIDLIRIDGVHRRPLTAALFTPTSNGNACGNSIAEAAVHALLEVIERDCICGRGAEGGEPVRVDPASITEHGTRLIVTALRRAGCRIELIDITNRLGIPCYSCRIWAPGYPTRYGGFGCHPAPQLAAGRAMGEAMQSRMATVAGARDDLHPDSYADQPMAEPGFSAAPTAPLRRTPAFVADSATVMLRSCAERVRRHTGVEPFVVDLTHPDLGVPAVKVFAPGLRLFRLDAPLFPERDR